MGKVTRQCPWTTILEEKRKESRSGSNQGTSAYQPSVLPLGHTGSHSFISITVLKEQADGRGDNLLLFNLHLFFWGGGGPEYHRACFSLLKEHSTKKSVVLWVVIPFYLIVFRGLNEMLSIARIKGWSIEWMWHTDWGTLKGTPSQEAREALLIGMQ